MVRCNINKPTPTPTPTYTVTTTTTPAPAPHDATRSRFIIRRMILLLLFMMIMSTRTAFTATTTAASLFITTSTTFTFTSTRRRISSSISSRTNTNRRRCQWISNLSLLQPPLHHHHPQRHLQSLLFVLPQSSLSVSLLSSLSSNDDGDHHQNHGRSCWKNRRWSRRNRNTNPIPRASSSLFSSFAPTPPPTTMTPDDAGAGGESGSSSLYSSDASSSSLTSSSSRISSSTSRPSSSSSSSRSRTRSSTSTTTTTSTSTPSTTTTTSTIFALASGAATTTSTWTTTAVAVIRVSGPAIRHHMLPRLVDPYDTHDDENSDHDHANKDDDDDVSSTTTTTTNATTATRTYQKIISRPRTAHLCHLYEYSRHRHRNKENDDEEDDFKTQDKTKTHHKTIKKKTPKPLLDQALVLFFPSPHSFTGEDVLELHVHGSRCIVLSVLETLSALGGVPAEAGEFTLRAFTHGKLNLVQVEALADVLASTTSRQRVQALHQLVDHHDPDASSPNQSISHLYASWRQQLIAGLAHAEAMIDFGDEIMQDNDEIDGNNNNNNNHHHHHHEEANGWGQVVADMHALHTQMHHHVRDHNDDRRGELVREGLRVVVMGPPNAGKSSLVNALVQREAAIVSPLAGTTRDVIECALALGGVPCRLMDTAGIRLLRSSSRSSSSRSSSSSNDHTTMAAHHHDEVDHDHDDDHHHAVIEQLGMDRALRAYAHADLVIAVMDCTDLSAGMQTLRSILSHSSLNTSCASASKSRRPPMLWVLNKSDLLNNNKTNVDASAAISTAATAALDADQEWLLQQLLDTHNNHDYYDDDEDEATTATKTRTIMTEWILSQPPPPQPQHNSKNQNQKKNVFALSCRTQQGMEAFVARLTRLVIQRVSGDHHNNEDDEDENNHHNDDTPQPQQEPPQHALITRARHRQHITAAVECLDRFHALCGGGSHHHHPQSQQIDLAAEELRLAASELGRVIGAVDVDDVLDKIFADFCIGK